MISILLVIGAVWCGIKANTKALVALKVLDNPPPPPVQVISFTNVRPTIMAEALVRRVERYGMTPERLTLALQLGPAARVPLGLSSAA